VVQLVADVRHRQLVDDSAVLGVDDGEEVGLLDAGSLVQAHEVEELLRGRLHRLLRRAMERRGLVVVRVHLSSFHVMGRRRAKIGSTFAVLQSGVRVSASLSLPRTVRWARRFGLAETSQSTGGRPNG
jgi:hypothetical protein